MAKGDTPPMRMVVEVGPRLAPRTASDAERLDTYRVGSEVNVVFTRNGSRVMEKKWWAILGLVVDRCNVPWKTKEQASEAIKLALGIVNLTKTVGGSWLQYPKSLTELSDPELDDAVRDMMDLITKMTGIDPDTLRKETADVGRDDEQESSGVLGEPDAGSGDDSPHVDPAPTEPASGGPSAPGEAVPPPAANPGADITPRLRECIDKFIGVATDNLVPDPAERRQVLATVKDIWKESLPEHLDFVKACLSTADKVVKGELPAGKARTYLEGLLP